MNWKELPSHSELKAALAAAVGSPPSGNGGFSLHMWATIVDRDGMVCAVAFSGNDRGDQWPGSRVISAQKANTANAFSLPGLALSTANLWAPVQPGGSLFGLQHSNPVDTNVAYGGNSDGSSPRQRAEFRRQLPEFASVMGWIGRSASVYRLLVRQRNPQRIEDFCLAGVGNRQPCDAGLLIHSIFQ